MPETNTPGVDQFVYDKKRFTRRKLNFNKFHLSLVTLAAFWIGVIFTHYILGSSFVHSKECSGAGCLKVSPVSRTMFENKNGLAKKDEGDVIDSEDDNEAQKQGFTKLITRKSNIDDTYEDISLKKLILLHGENVWTQYDNWHRYDWNKCPISSSNCRITTDLSRTSSSDAIVYNSAKMPTSSDMEKVKGYSAKHVFLSGLTPLRTRFKPSDYDDFFDTTISYKSNSDVRIPYWPNDGLLPAMYRPKPTTKVIEGEEMLDIEGRNEGLLYSIW